ncbi:type II secretion system protein [Meiothermus sp. QL-1]|uniref:type II secretion system protein n=1 Tax=Meiothermus sp. QL-1 TaxID=2058095 RepID=UPI000E0A9196|nr:type II secretion system protein [Meiothermus sp. QL-1]RDI95156.1 type II secretion system protein [Meiothermus sp. QL-1]
MWRSSYRPLIAGWGFTLLELLVVMAILGVAAGIGLAQFRNLAQRQEALATVDQIRQLFWQGATAAASRGGTNFLLVRSGNTLRVESQVDGSVLRSVTLPAGVSCSLPQGTLATFTSPGKVNFSSSFPPNRQFTITANGQTFTLTATLIGEVRRQ